MLSPFIEEDIQNLTPERIEEIAHDSIMFRRWFIDRQVKSELKMQVAHEESVESTKRINEFGCDAFRHQHANAVESDSDGQAFISVGNWKIKGVVGIVIAALVAVIYMQFHNSNKIGVGNDAAAAAVLSKDDVDRLVQMQVRQLLRDNIKIIRESADNKISVDKIKEQTR